jgi:hypothetical protein
MKLISTKLLILAIGLVFYSNSFAQNTAETFVYGDGSTTPLTDYHPATVTGNFTWMRVRVDGFSGGTINAVTITY